jgi:hypothetical protein
MSAQSHQQERLMTKTSSEEGTQGSAASFTLLKRHLLQWTAFVGCAAGVVALISGESVQLVTAIAAFVAVGILALAAPVDLLRRYLAHGVEVGVLGFSAKIPPIPADAPREEDDAPAKDLMGLRFKLEQKMTFLAKHVLGTPAQPAYLTIGSMVHDGLIERRAAQILAAVTSLRVPSAGDLQSGESLEDWLVLAQRAVATFRADVLSRSVYTRLEKAAIDGNPVFSVDRHAGIEGLPRAALVTPAGSSTPKLVVIPVFSYPPNGSIFESATRHAAAVQHPLLFVCPPRSQLGNADMEVRGDVVRLPGVLQEVSRRLNVKCP